MYILSSLLKIQLWVSDLHSDSAPEMSAPSKCDFLKTMILHLSLISPGHRALGSTSKYNRQILPHSTLRSGPPQSRPE